MTQLMIRIKPWALFLILVCPAMIASIVSEPGEYSVLEILANIIGTIIYFFWLWSINDYVRRATEIRGDIFFTVCLGFVFLCFVVFNLYALFNEISNLEYSSIASAIVLSLTVYCIVVTSRRLKSFELSRKAAFAEYFKDFVLLLIFPIGIWFLQPRINKL